MAAKVTNKRVVYFQKALTSTFQVNGSSIFKLASVVRAIHTTNNLVFPIDRVWTVDGFKPLP